MKPKDNFDKIIKTNISDVACKNGLYDIPEYLYKLQNIPRTKLESDFSKFETKLSPLIMDVLEECNKSNLCYITCLNTMKKKELISQITLQLFRTPDKYNYFTEHFRLHLDELTNLISDSNRVDKHNLLNSIEKFSNEDIMYYLFLDTFVKLSNGDKSFFNTYLEKLNMEILINNTQINFITTDNPVTIFNQNRKKVGWLAGLTNNKSQIYYPLSPKVCLRLNIKGITNNFVPVIYIKTKAGIKKINDLMILNANQYIYIKPKA